MSVAVATAGVVEPPDLVRAWAAGAGVVLRASCAFLSNLDPASPPSPPRTTLLPLHVPARGHTLLAAPPGLPGPRLPPSRPEPLAPFPSGCVTSPLCRSFPVLPSLPNKTNPSRSRSALSPAGTPRAPPAPAAGSCQAAAPKKAVETGEGARARHGSSARAPSPGRSALHCRGEVALPGRLGLGWVVDPGPGKEEKASGGGSALWGKAGSVFCSHDSGAVGC